MSLALAFSRLFRIGRSYCGPLTAFISFSVLLSFFLILYKPTAGPGRIQRLGWQSWELVTTVSPEELALEPLPPLPKPPSKPPSDGKHEEWWETGAEPEAATTSLPLDIWAPLLPHDTGLTEIAITRCLVNPVQIPFCWPRTTKEEDAIKGEWVRVERDLNIKSGIYWLHLYYRRTRRLDVPLITDLMLLGRDESSHVPKPIKSWHIVDHSIRDGVIGQPALFLHYKLGPTRGELDAQGASNIITEIDVLHGDGPAWPGFEKMDKPVTEGKKGQTDSVWLTYRRGVKPLPPTPRLHFSHSGEFKILQAADLHLSVSHMPCRDSNSTTCVDADAESATFFSQALDAEKPDLVVFTGDQLNGQGTSWDTRSVLAKFAAPVIARKIPWAAVFGNHDDETDMERQFEMAFLQMLPYNLVQPGPRDVYGVGNYVLKVHSADASKTQLLTLYFLDSNAYSKGVFDWLGWHPTEYDWIHESQVDWFLSESAKVPPIERPFLPDGGKDLSKIWDREDKQRKLAKPNAMMFFHIPLQESYSNPDIDPTTNKPLDVGQQIDGSGAAKTNGGLFQNGLLKAKESDWSHQTEVKIVANGHCHVTDRCRRVLGVWLCFGGGSSVSGYGKVGFDRRFRIYKISDYGETITTYKRTESGEIVDQMALVGKDAPTPFAGHARK